MVGDTYWYHLVMQADEECVSMFFQCALSQREKTFSPTTCAVGVTIQERQPSTGSVVVSATCATTPLS